MLSVVIPTFKNEGELIKNLAHNLPFLKGCEVIVVNDNPEQSIEKRLEVFPQIVLIENQKILVLREQFIKELFMQKRFCFTS